MLDQQASPACCGRCTGLGSTEVMTRRRYYKAAIFAPSRADRADVAVRSDDPSAVAPARVATGIAVDASPHALRIAGPGGERSFAFVPGTRAWRGRISEPTAVRPGDPVIVRLVPGRREVADKVWACIGRVTGTIAERQPDGLVVDEGRTRERQLVTLAPSVLSRILVRFPQLEPGNLIDVIGLRHGAMLEAVLPATAQPTAIRLELVPQATARTGRADALRGSVTWHEPLQPGENLEGAAYPAVDPSCGCPEISPGSGQHTAGRLPYLAIGSMLRLRNECTGTVGDVQVSTCAAVASLFSDRCLTCGTSPRGRIADLTAVSFVRLGGELERGCFNAIATIGR